MGGFEGDAVCLGLHLKANVTQWEEALWHYAADVLRHGNGDTAPAGVPKTNGDLLPPSSGPFFFIAMYTFYDVNVRFFESRSCTSHRPPGGGLHLIVGKLMCCMQFFILLLVSVAVVVVAT